MYLLEILILSSDSKEVILYSQTLCLDLYDLYVSVGLVSCHAHAGTMAEELSV